MAATLIGPRVLSCTRNDDGHREYKVKWLVHTDDFDDGPAVVLATPGLPLPGAIWAIGNDVDLWAWCRPDATVSLHEHKEGDKHKWWVVEQTFGTAPLPLNSQRCQDTPIEDPLLEPAKVSGGFKTYQEEASFDKDGNPIHNSAWEQVRGSQVEFDTGRPTVTIEQNVATQAEALSIPASLMHHVNDAPMWGLPARCVKLSNHSWSKQYHGQCSVYYTRTLEFDIMYETFDRVLLDEGTKVLNGHWGNGQGAGATVNITTTATGGVVTAVALGAQGAGYEPSCTVGLKLSQGTARGGIVLAKTDSNGKVTSVSVYRGGSGYSVAFGVTTQIGHGWVLDHLKHGNPPALDTPDRNNPAHFKRFTDKEGNPATVILDGRGVPIGGLTGDETNVGSITVAKYTASNLFQLGIPAVL